MSRIMPTFCSSVRPAAMLTVISGIVHSLFRRGHPRASIKQDVDARHKADHEAVRE
jgi:hypothetical protein